MVGFGRPQPDPNNFLSFLNGFFVLLLAGVALLDSDRPPPVHQLPSHDSISDYVAELLASADVSVFRKRSKRRNRSPSGLPRGKRRKSNLDRAGALQCVLRDYFGPKPIFNDRQFERFFRVTHTHAEFIISSLAIHDKQFWTQTYDATGKPSISPIVKFLAAQKCICYGVTFNAFCDYFQMGESTARLCVSKLSRGIVSCPKIRNVYLRDMPPANA